MTVPVLTTAAALASSPPPLPGFLNALASPLQHYGLWAIGLLIMLEDFGIPVPGETVLILAAVYAGSGRLNIFLVALLGFAGALLGDNIGFAIGHFGGRPLVERYGRYVLITPERLDKATGFFQRHGGKIIIVARFIEGLRQANGIIAGISGMRWTGSPRLQRDRRRAVGRGLDQRRLLRTESGSGSGTSGPGTAPIGRRRSRRR